MLKALGVIGSDGWATSEVNGGGESELADIAAQMKRVLGVGSFAAHLSLSKCEKFNAWRPDLQAIR